MKSLQKSYVNCRKQNLYWEVNHNNFIWQTLQNYKTVPFYNIPTKNQSYNILNETLFIYVTDIAVVILNE